MSPCCLPSMDDTHWAAALQQQNISTGKDGCTSPCCCRVKGINYLASVVKTYRDAIDSYMDETDSFTTKSEWISELNQVYHREYCTGFYFGNPDTPIQNYQNIHAGKIHSFIGKVLENLSNHNCKIEVRNKISINDPVEILSPKASPQQTKVIELFDDNNNPIESAHPNTCARLNIGIQCQPNDIVRKI